MKTKKQSLKIVQVGTLFISILGIISLSNGKISNLSKDENEFKLVNTSFADDDEDRDDDRDDEEEDNEDEDDYKYVSTPVIVNEVVNTSVTSPLINSVITVTNTSIPETNIKTTTITQTGSNCKTVYDTVYETGYTTTYETVYDTVTSASGRTSRVAKQVAKQTPKQVAKQVSHEVCEAAKEIIKETVIVENTGTTNTGILNNEIKAKVQKLFKAPNSKIYSIIEENGIFSIKKADGSYAKKTFNTYIEAENYLNINAIPAPENYKAANGKNYTIMFENKKVVVKKSDWSYAKQSFSTYSEAKIYLDKNAPKQIIKKTVAKIASPVKKTTVLNTKVTKTVTAKATPKPVVKAPAPKVDTTTKAS